MKYGAARLYTQSNNKPRDEKTSLAVVWAPFTSQKTLGLHVKCYQTASTPSKFTPSFYLNSVKDIFPPTPYLTNYLKSKYVN